MLSKTKEEVRLKEQAKEGEEYIKNEK